MPPLDTPSAPPGAGARPAPAAPRAERARPNVDARALEAALRAAIGGEVRFDKGSLAVYAHDASNYRQVPIGVVLPKTVEDIVAAVAVCREHGAPILARGGGTAQNGQTVNVAVVIDCSKYLNKVLEVDALARSARVEPGVVCDALRDAAEEHALTFGPDPATHSRCTLGGMIGNNSCGAHSVMAGKTVENIEALEVLTYDGLRLWVGPTSDDDFARIVAEGGRRAEIYTQLKALAGKYAELIRTKYPKIKRRVSGYNLDQLLPENGFNVARALVGSEGSCAITLQAKTRLVESPQQRVLLVLGYPDIYRAGDAVPQILPFGPIATEGLDQKIIGGLRVRGLRLADIAKLPAGDAWIMIEFGADTVAAASAQAQALIDHYRGRADAPSHWLIDDPAVAEAIWTIRETAASASALGLAGSRDPQVGWEDAAVDPLRLGDYLREFQALVDRYGYETSLYGHFGDGCIHARITFDLRSAEGVAKWRAFTEDAAHLVVRYGGSLSGEHGDGQAKAEFLPVMYGPELMQAFREFKAIWDPAGKMNPGKLIDAWRIDENLRYGPGYKPIRFDTKMKFATPEGDGFARSVEHCVGMGKCRSQSGGVMCPSYRITGEEKYSTRGRSRLFGEMLRGEVIRDGWQSEAVKEALDLCLACKGCKSDCPTHTDMASYKAEFLYHYHQFNKRPVQAWSMGLIHRWAKLASRMPGLVNGFTQTPGLNVIAKRLAGIALQREVPTFAARTFKQRFFARTRVPAGAAGVPPAGEGSPVAGRDAGAGSAAPPRTRVILWADTFNNHFHPDTAMAAVKVLEYAGYEVSVPRAHLCCGRALYDFGLLDQAERQLQEIMLALAGDIDAGTPIIGLEPACVAVFRDELLKLFPDDPRAQKLAAQVKFFSEFLVAEGVKLPVLGQPHAAGAAITTAASTPGAASALGVAGAAVATSGATSAPRALVHGHCHQKAVIGMAADFKLLDAIGMPHSMIDSSCCGMSGSFGFSPQHYDLSVKAAELSLLPALRACAEGTTVISNGYSCREQIAQLGGRKTRHVAEVVADAIAGASAGANDTGRMR
jgi:FAD/FMN-containing dehydrogenase/Fe-S oxidoreductase